MSDPTLIGTVAGLTVARWGTTGGASLSAMGIVTSVRRRKDGEEYKLKNITGNTIAHIFYDSRDEGEVEIIALDDATLPDRGDVIAIAGLSLVVLNAEEMWAQEDLCKFKINAVKHASVVIA